MTSPASFGGKNVIALHVQECYKPTSSLSGALSSPAKPAFIPMAWFGRMRHRQGAHSLAGAKKTELQATKCAKFALLHSNALDGNYRMSKVQAGKSHCTPDTGQNFGTKIPPHTRETARCQRGPGRLGTRSLLSCTCIPPSLRQWAAQLSRGSGSTNQVLPFTSSVRS